MMKAEIYKHEGYTLMGAAFEVNNEAGYGMVEEIHQESLEFELEAGRNEFDGHKDGLEWKRLILSQFIPSAASASISAN